MTRVRRSDAQPFSAGIVTAMVGFSSTFALVLAGLQAVGATQAEASSGLLALGIGMGAVAIWLSVRTRMPVSVAWSTPGAALLLSTGALDGGYAAAVGAFLVCGVLLALAGASDRLGRWIAAIPGPIASAMLAGVLLPICVAPAQALVELPWQTAPVILTWLVLTRVARRWAVPAAIAAATIVILATETVSLSAGDVLATPTWTTPAFDLGAIVGLGLPLFLVTMASQNITGMTVLSSFGYHPPMRPVLLSTGATTAVGAPFGLFAINLAAISAALVAGPDGGPDPQRRWIGATVAGVAYMLLGLTAGAAVALLAAAPALLIEAVAGLALLGAFASALAGATADERYREPAVVTLVVSASAITALSVSAPFWGLLAGLALLGAQRLRRPQPAAARRERRLSPPPSAPPTA